MDYTQMIGNTNEMKCITAFMLLGYECSIPYGNGAKYDFIVDIDNKLLRIQCKSSSYVNDHGKIRTDAIHFYTTSQTTNTKETIRYKYDSNLIDYFATSFEDKVYVVPVSECSTGKTLRFSPPNNGNSNYNKAEDYLIEKVFEESEKLIVSRENYNNRMTKRSEESKKYYCNECGKEISPGSTLCQDCFKKSQTNPNIPDRNTLKELIRKFSFTQIGDMYNITDNGIRKWCIKYNLPSKKSEIKTITDEDWLNI